MPLALINVLIIIVVDAIPFYLNRQTCAGRSIWRSVQNPNGSHLDGSNPAAALACTWESAFWWRVS
jgi:hypothetical protein